MVFEGNVNDPLTSIYCTLFCQSVVISSQLWNSMTCHLTRMEVARECLSLIFEWRELRLGLESSVATYFLPLCHCERYSDCYVSRDHTISFSEPVNCCLNNWAHWVFSFLRYNSPNSQFLSVVCCSFKTICPALFFLFLLFLFLFHSFISFCFCRSLLSFFSYSFCAYVCIKDLTKVFAYSLPVAWGSVFTLFAQTVTQRGLRSHGVSITGSIRRHLSSSQLCAGHVFARRCLATGQLVAWQVRKQCHSPPGMTPGSLNSTAPPWNNFSDIYATILSQHPFVLSKNPPTGKVFGETMFSMTPRSLSRSQSFKYIYI